ncbi:hypothetical protein TL18_00800 [Methanobrevibacter sp. YE315]|nr:hypothetical protein TL18_00800 [Methanobrevibacter sp. YE315]
MIILVSILLLIFTLGAVSAADANITDTTDEVLTAEPTDELEVSEGDFGELSSLVSGTSSGKTLTLDKDYINSQSSNRVTISKAITIDGQGHTIDANGKSNIFHVNNAKVTLKNINFKNSFTKNYSAVYGTCTIINCTFTDCTSEKDGGAIYNGTAYDSTFTNCNAYRYENERQYYKSDHHICKGGAIYNGDAYNCNFINCYAKYSYYDGWEPDCDGFGGAIYNGNAYDCSFIECYSVGGGAIIGDAYNSTFEECRAFAIWTAGCGGAIQGDARNCSFVNCRSEYGGAIYGGNAYESSFIGCYVVDGAGGSSGGAIESGDAYNCYFEKCYSYEGAAICMGDAYSCTFVECICEMRNAAIIKKGNAYDSAFINCTTERGIYIDGDYRNCTFIPITLSCSNLTVNYGEGGKLQIKTQSNGINVYVPVNVKIYKDNKLTNSFSTISGSDLPIDAAPGNYMLELSCVGANPLNVSLVVNKRSPQLTLANNFAKTGETANVKVTMSKKATGYVRITINGETYRLQIKSGAVSVDVPNLADGAYTVTATYGGNAYHTAETMTDTFHVGKFKQGMQLETNNIAVGETERITATLAKDATGFVRFIIGDNTYKVAIENGAAYVDINNLKAGTYSVTLKYAGNYKYNAETVSKTFTVSKSSPEMSVMAWDTLVGRTTDIRVNLANDAPGNVHIIVNGETYKTPIKNGVATITISGLKAGTYNVTAKYAGNYKYNAETVSKTFTVSKSSPGLKVTTTHVEFGVKTITVNLAGDASGNVHIIVNGETYKTPIKNGVATITISGLKVGTYNVTAKYAGNYKYNAETRTTSFSVNKIIPAPMSVSAKAVNGKTVITAKINPDVEGVMRITYEGTAYFVNITNGVATATIDGVIPGTHNIIVKYTGNDKYSVRVISKDITI